MTAFIPNTSASVLRRIGKSALELELTDDKPSCPDILEFDDGNFGIIGIDITEDYKDKLPDDFSVGENEKLVVIPREMLIAAKTDIPND